MPLRKGKLKCAKYLKNIRFSISETQLLFQLRTRMFAVKSNFKNKYKVDQSCELCKINESNQEHQLSCPVLIKFLPELSLTNVQYKDLFGNVDKQLKFIKVYSKIARQREIFLERLWVSI